MSGGYFENRDRSLMYWLEELAEESIKGDLPSGTSKEDTKIIEGDYNAALALLELGAKKLRRIDYLLSGDDGVESYHRRVAEEGLNKPKPLYAVMFAEEYEADVAVCILEDGVEAARIVESCNEASKKFRDAMEKDLNNNTVLCDSLRETTDVPHRACYYGARFSVKVVDITKSHDEFIEAHKRGR